jgi:hypothetical protein
MYIINYYLVYIYYSYYLNRLNSLLAINKYLKLEYSLLPTILLALLILITYLL